MEKQLPVGVRNVRANSFPVNIDVDLYILRLLILPKTCSKVRNSVFVTHCTVDTLDVVHTGGHAVASSEIHGVTPFTILTDRQNPTNISGNVSAI